MQRITYLCIKISHSRGERRAPIPRHNWLHAHKQDKTMHESDSIVIIPTYNEKENIEKIIRAVFGLEKCFHG